MYDISCESFKSRRILTDNMCADVCRTLHQAMALWSLLHTVQALLRYSLRRHVTRQFYHPKDVIFCPYFVVTAVIATR